MSEFLNKDEFHKYVIDNRDRQDANKREIIETLTRHQDQELGELGGRVEKLEDENTKQNRIAGGITALNAAVIGILAYLK
jgi:hypothetical protein